MDSRSEITREEYREVHLSLNGHQYAELFQKRGFDLAYIDDLLALHGSAVAGLSGLIFYYQKCKIAMGNRLMKNEQAGENPIVFMMESPREERYRLKLESYPPEYHFFGMASHAMVRVRKPHLQQIPLEEK